MTKRIDNVLVTLHNALALTKAKLNNQGEEVVTKNTQIHLSPGNLAKRCAFIKSPFCSAFFLEQTVVKQVDLI